ncbi:hypothetical protein [Methylomonas rivi]|uniref:Radical SAM protein n=1 Tax=Methylomonas rivi TaxID=2952226 RepID=A0ABT1U6K2_9GAMM|nr:hypothetical protein [Methylomonas sp. WSC-6]MCQ8129472.1 hypothetical protein [Methylomonas sp. WSC-6]
MSIKQTYQDFFGTQNEVVVRINATNKCNLHCDHCDVGCHLPISKSSPNIFRQAPFVAESHDIEKFCEAFVGVGEENLHLLQGGEITILPMKRITRYVEVLSAYGRKVGMRTNGYNVVGIPDNTLSKLSCIYLTTHGVNQQAIDTACEYLARNYHGKVVVDRVIDHRNMETLIKHGQGSVEQGLKCNHLLATMTYIPPVIYPCCNSWSIMHNLNDAHVHNLLIAAGWSVNNPNVKETVANWKQTLPREFFENLCADSCYLTNPLKVIPMHRIQPHPNDKIIKM